MVRIALAFVSIAIIFQATESVRRIVAKEGSNVTLFHRPGGFVPGTGDAEQIMTYPMSNFSPRVVYKNASCRDVKDNGGKDIKVATNVTGELKQEYQVNADESEYGRVDYILRHGLQDGNWNIYSINRHDFGNLYILCTKGNGRDGTLTYKVDDFVRLEEISALKTSQAVSVQYRESSTTHLRTASTAAKNNITPKSPAGVLSDGAVVGIVIGSLAAFVSIVLVVIYFCKSRTRQGKPELNGVIAYFPEPEAHDQGVRRQIELEFRGRFL